MTTAFRKGFSSAPFVLAPIMGAGFAATFIVNDLPFGAWVYVPVAIVLLGAIPFLAGWLSPRLSKIVLFPASVLVSLTVGFAVYGVDADVEPISYTVLLTLIYGGLASVGFFVGWVLRGHEFINHPRGGI